MEKMQMSIPQEEKILVIVRLRPLNEKEIAANEAADWECINDTTVLYRNTLREGSNFPSAYSFDKVYGGECPTRQVYEDGTKDIALSVVKGINCKASLYHFILLMNTIMLSSFIECNDLAGSIFAYGQTSSGKTYTMTGITEFAVADIFDYIFQHEERAFSVKFSAIEIYNEAIRDLLSSDSTTSLRLRDDPEKGTVVDKATEETLRDWNHLKELLSICEAQRKIGETSLNEKSSRSHQIIRLTVESSAREFLNKENSTTLMASVSFIDLAGSERASQAMSAGERLKEGCHINRSLLTLGTVIRKLSKGRQGHINFRDSKLTRILQPCLGGNARTAIICTLSPARSHVELTRNTLLFARCAKEITTKAKINVVLSDKALLKQLQRELARLETELRNPLASPASNCDCSMTVKKKDLQIQKMEKQIKVLRNQRDLAQSRLEDFMRMVEHYEASKSGTPNFGNHTEKWEDGSVSDTSGVFGLDRSSYISDGMLTPLSIPRAYVRSYSDEDNIDEELPRRSEEALEEYCREVQCIEIEESSTVYNNHKDKTSEHKNILGHSQDVRLRSWRHRETVQGTITPPPENLRTDFLGRQESRKIVFPDSDFGSSVSRNDSMSSFGSDSTAAQGFKTPLGEEGGIASIQTFVEGLKEMVKRQGEDDDFSKMDRDIGLDSMNSEFEKQRREILELWQTCNVSLVHRTYFYLLFKGDQADSIYIGVELRRLLFMKDSFSQGNQSMEVGETLTLASSRKALHKERKMLSKLMGKRFTEEERRRIYHKFGIAVNSKRRRLQLVNELWSNHKDMTQVVESADVVAKLVRFSEQGKAMKEMFSLSFAPPSFLSSRRSHSWRSTLL
ncbi:unnamed protein product [Cochlearia groenlandica]